MINNPYFQSSKFNIPSRSFAWSPDSVDTDGASSLREVTEVTETDNDEAIEDGERLETLLTVGAAVVTETAVRVVPDPTPMGPPAPELDTPEDWRLVPKVSFLRILLTLPETISLGDTFPDTRLESEGAFD